MKTKKKVALVLSGGGALGCAHIGVIKVLRKYGIPVDIIVGTSMGGVVGAGMAVGLSTEDMIKFALKFRTIDFFDVNFNTSGLFSGKGVMKIINKFLPDITIQSLNTTFACVACDLYSEKEVVFTTGSIRDAVRATLSIPGVFVPFQKDDMLLVDGGMLNNLPEDVAMKLGADVIISCDVLSGSKVNSVPKNAIDSFLSSINLATKEMQKLKSVYSDICLKPDMDGLGQFSFADKKTLLAIRRGEEVAERHIAEIIKIIKQKLST
ncbi:MAG: patatin-like phospholipase family protein [Clostridia bacterium]|nr:patatin-like phospholipase family protein [Clostridia bacterium]